MRGQITSGQRMTEYTVHCFYCDTQEKQWAKSKKELLPMLREADWQFTFGEWICSACAKTQRAAL